jgi:hypothetical protein
VPDDSNDDQNDEQQNQHFEHSWVLFGSALTWGRAAFEQ